MRQAPPPERRRGIPLFPIILIALGVVLLLQTLNVLPWSLWNTLWRFWPVVLILIGLNMLLRRVSPWAMTAIAFLVIAAVVGISVAVEWPFPSTGTYDQSFAELLGDLERAKVDVDFGAGRLLLRSLPTSSPNLAEGKFTTSGRGVDVSMDRRNGAAELKLRRRDGRRFWGSPEERWELELSGQIPLELDIDAGASDVDLDLSDLRVSRLTLDVGASQAQVRFPRAAGITNAFVKAGAASVTLIVPPDVAARISVSSGLSSIDIDESRFPKSGAYHESPRFSQAENRLVLEVDSGAARLEIR